MAIEIARFTTGLQQQPMQAVEKEVPDQPELLQEEVAVLGL